MRRKPYADRQREELLQQLVAFAENQQPKKRGREKADRALLALVARSGGLHHGGDAPAALQGIKPREHVLPGGRIALERLPVWTTARLEVFRLGLKAFLRDVAAIAAGGGLVPSKEVRVCLEVAAAGAGPERGPNAVMFVDGSPADVLWFQALMLLRDVGLERLRTCPECKGLFVKIGKRDYCTDRCQNTNNQRRHRRAKAEARAAKLSLSPRLSLRGKKRA